MMSNYQQLNNYSGSLYGEPNYQGIEYDWEVPDNLVIGSPGGVDSIHHHWTKGFYGRGNTSSDVYAGQRQRYIAGEYGNLYNTGQTAAQHMGYYPAPPDYQFWQNEVPQQASYAHSPADMNNNGQPLKKDDRIENYEDFELIQPPDEDDNTSAAPTKWSVKMFFFFLFLLICFGLWWTAGDQFIKQHLYQGQIPPWTTYTLYAVVATLILILLVWTTGVP